jgi:scavenger receptor class B, member 1
MNFCKKKGYRFRPPKGLFDTLAERPENECFCTSSAACNIKGVFNISACKFGAPIAISWPHFLHGDPKLLKHVEGLNPDPTKHEFFMDLHPVTKPTLIISLQVV